MGHKTNLLLLCLCFVPLLLEATILRVDDGVYSRLTVKVTDAVPRQHCQRAIRNLKVRWQLWLRFK